VTSGTAGADGAGRETFSIGAVAAQLGVAPETVRSWGTRYGLVPSSRTGGGHRRYSAADLTRLIRMQRLVGYGVAPARAAQQALATPEDGSDAVLTLAGEDDAGSATHPPRPADRRRRGGPGGRVLAIRDGSPEARGLARAAGRLDVDAVGGMLGDLLAEWGAVATWIQVLRPVLVAVGRKWERTGDGIEVEHLLSEATVEALRAHRQCQVHAVPGRPVLLACSSEDLHVLPLHIIAAALSEHRVPLRMLGARVPLTTLTAAVRRTGASAVFVWRQIKPAGVEQRDEYRLELTPTRPPVLAVVGGPGWDGVDLPARTRRAADLAEAVAVLRAAPR